MSNNELPGPLKEQIDLCLRRVFDQYAQEELPEDLKGLVENLKRQTKQARAEDE